ncbi:hypothetical protein RHMOL_Rhmol06G0054600 [Rhododendron molle]|uniref:Uncharacterized protein n=1 Tax=Rhododendron molle TaxID=49168 RepID=A0ACC0NAB8_RHOML|nr:hypothetical protein RHMOL_Rhmol06G0054600 [Rhododendron molle]
MTVMPPRLEQFTFPSTMNGRLENANHRRQWKKKRQLISHSPVRGGGGGRNARVVRSPP